MSLVAYGASDDSEQSDSESLEQVEDTKKSEIRDDPISDDEDAIQTSTNSSSLVQIQTSSSSSIFSSSFLGIGGTTQDLPTPKKTERTVNEVEESELEEEVRQKPAELADAPKPPPKRTKQTVKITIPSLNDIADEEEEGESKQKPVASTQRSGLFSLLPPPIHSARKEINRPLVPHSLAKKTPPAKPTNVQNKPSRASASSNVTKDSTSKNTNSIVQSALAGYGSDSSDDDEASNTQNFFSLGQKSVLPTKSDSESINKPIKATVEVKSDELKSEMNKAAASSPLPQEDEIVAPAPPEPGLTNDLPLSFNNPSRSWSATSSSYHGSMKPITQSYGSYAQSSSGMVSSAQYNMVGTDDADEIDQPNTLDDDLHKMLGDREFQKLNGKRKRGMEEAINFVDAKVDDYVDPSELSKHVTEETEYTSTKNKDNMPTSQQKRKKQITYLAFQAKEKEMELKNTWAQNKLTRRQTQAKYGF